MRRIDFKINTQKIRLVLIFYICGRLHALRVFEYIATCYAEAVATTFSAFRAPSAQSIYAVAVGLSAFRAPSALLQADGVALSAFR